MKMTIMHNGVAATIDGTAEECARFLRELSVGSVPTVGWGQPLPKVDLSKGPDAFAYSEDKVAVNKMWQQAGSFFK